MQNNVKHLFRNKIGTRIISLFLTILILFFAIPSIVYAETAEALKNLADEDEAALLSYGEESAIGGAEIYEAEELRGENTKHFRLADGSYALAVYPTNVHRLNEDGKYEDIDNRLYNLFGEVQNSDGNIKFSKKVNGNSRLFTIHNGNGKITFSLLGAIKGTKGEITNNEDGERASENELQKKMKLQNLSSAIVYRDILDGTDIEYVLNGSNVKENIIIKEKSESYSYSFEIEVNGYLLSMQDDSSILVLRENAEIEYVIPAPVIFDSNGAHGSANYTLSEGNGNGKYILTVNADESWVNSDERAFPITLDPAIYAPSSTVTNTYVDSENPNRSHLNNVSYYIYTGKTIYWKTSDVSFIPKNAYISSANLIFRTSTTADAYAGVYPVTSEWDENLDYNDTQSFFSPDGAVSNDIISYTHVKGGATEYFAFDITEALQSWIDDPSQNFGVALKHLSGNEIVFYSSQQPPNYAPCLQINYVNQNGLESYNSYSSHNVGGIANAHVNLATGELVMDIPLLSATNSIMPYTVSLVYDSAGANGSLTNTNHNVPYTARIAPYGYKWSMQQSVVKRSYKNESNVTENLYIWCDSDGTEHSFFESEVSGVYEDNEGLNFKLREISGTVTISYKTDTVYTFSRISSPSEYSRAWHLSSISDKNGNKIEFTYDSTNYKPLSVKFIPNGSTSGFDVMRFLYASSSSVVPKAVYDPLTGKGVVFYYSDTYNSSTSAAASLYLRSVRYVTGKISWTESMWLNYITGNDFATFNISYNSAGYISRAIDITSNSGVSYTYSADKVSSVYEENSLVSGQKLTYTYGVGYTDIRASGANDAYGNDDDIITRYVFDTYGRAVSVYNRNVYGTRVFGGVNGTYETEDSIRNNLKQVTSLKEGSLNYLVNGGFEKGTDGFENWTKTTAVEAEINYNEPYSTKSVKISVSGPSNNYLYQKVYLKAGTYTLSLDLATVFANGVGLGANIVNTSNSSDSIYISFAKNERLNDYNQARSVKRVGASFTINSASTYRVEIIATGSASTSGASIYIDNVMLTFGSEMTAYNMLSVSGFDSFAYTPSGSSVYWTDVWSYTATSAVAVGADSLSGNSLYISSDTVTDKREVIQTVYSKSESLSPVYERKFVLSGFAKSINATRSKDAKFALKAVVVYSDNTNDEFYFDFLPTCTDWQFVSGTFTTNAYNSIKRVDVVCEFSGQISAYAFFDNITLIDASDYSLLDYSYHEGTGNVRTVTDGMGNVEYYRYNDNDEIIAKATSTGLLYEYAYNSNGNLITETLYSYYTNQYGQGGVIIYPVDSDNPNSLITRTRLMQTIYTYDSYGLLLSENTAAYTDGVIETTSMSNTYTYDTSSQVFFGYVKTHTDPLGNVVRCFYNTTDTGIVSATVNEETQSGTAVYTDIWGNMEKALPVINVTSTGYTAESDAESVRYTYNARNQLAAIYTDSTRYILSYDSYGNQSSVIAGSNTLATYTYNENNGKLKKVTYGNGFIIEYVYNDLENISEIWYTVNGSNTLAYKYTYTESGLLHKVEDVRNSKTVVYNYDKNQRLIFASEYNNSDMYSDFTANVDYDDMGNVDFLNYMLAYSVGTQVYDKNFYYYYYYDDIQRIESERLTLGSSIYADTSYVYDKMQRLSGLTLNYEDSFILQTDYTFTENGTRTSGQVSGYKNTINGSITSNLTYEYDGNGNILSIKVGTDKKYRYKYDNLGQLIREDNVPENKTYVYIYDNAGNITEKRIYALTAYSAEPSGSYTSIPYVYSTSMWGDLLTSYNGSSITYDSIGNPLSYYNCNTFTWEGRRLIGAVVGSKTLSFAYNDEGIRTSKTVNGVKTNYYYYGSQLLAEETNGNITVYLYNSTGLIGFQYRASNYSANTWDTYFYERNLQGDIVAVYDANGVKKISYIYNAWGAFTTIYHNGANASTVSNAFTYRGYYYDKDLGLYYLTSRYYDANICRFVNADGQLNTYSLLGYNLFAYCENNPVVRVDYGGRFWDYIVDIGFLAWSIVDVVNDPDDWKNWAALTVDVVLAVVPFVPSGGGQVIKAGNKIDNALDVANAINKVDDVQDIAKVTMIGRNMNRVTNTANMIGKADNLYEAWKGYDVTATGMKKILHNGISMTHNGSWLFGKLRQGYTVIDIGLSTMHKSRGLWYGTERFVLGLWETRNIWKLIINYYF